MLITCSFIVQLLATDIYPTSASVMVFLLYRFPLDIDIADRPDNYNLSSLNRNIRNSHSFPALIIVVNILLALNTS